MNLRVVSSYSFLLLFFFSVDYICVYVSVCERECVRKCVFVRVFV